MVEDRGARLVYLPSYSPDFNPIELTFSTIKQWLRLNRDRVNRELESVDGTVYNVFWEAVHSVCYDRGSDFSARLLTGYDYGTPQVSSRISHGQSSQSAGSITCMIVTHS